MSGATTGSVMRSGAGAARRRAGSGAKMGWVRRRALRLAPKTGIAQGRPGAPGPYAYRLKSNEALVPPKPKEFESAYSMAIGRALWGT